MKKIIAYFIVLLFSINTVYSEESKIENSDLYNQILFLIDCSNSMNYHDENKLVGEIFKMFVDASFSTKTDIGFVTYNDRMLKSYSLTSMNDKTNRENIKKEISEIKRYGNTDIGMALDYGTSLFEGRVKDNNRPVIVLFSDGETDLNNSVTGRTMADSLADENRAYEKLKKINCPVYTVGISKNGGLNTEYLQKIADNTNGKKYEIQNSDELLNVFNNLFTDVTGTKVITKNPIISTGEPQQINIKIPGNYAEETNIILQHKSELQNISIENASGEIYKSKNYSGIKLINPDATEIKINLTAQKGDEIKANITNYINIYPKIEEIENLSAREITINAKLHKASGEELKENYQNLNAELLITDISTGEIEILPMETSKEYLSAVYKNDYPKSTKLEVKLKDEDYSVSSKPFEATFLNNSPTQIKTIDKILFKKNHEKEYDLDRYFKDSDGDSLEYKLSSQKSEISEASIVENKLILKTLKEGNDEIFINVIDDRGGTLVGKFSFDALPFWIYYKNIYIGIGCIFITLLTLYILLKLKTDKSEIVPAILPAIGIKFSGARFEGYFLNTLSGNEVPVLNWNASYIENKHSISLGELFAMMDVFEKLPEAHKIHLKAGNNSTVLFHHDTDCIVSLGDRNIPSGKKEVLNYDDRLYIVFEDHVTEMELRYKRVRKMSA